MFDPGHGMSIYPSGGLRISAAVKSPFMSDDDCSIMARIVADCKVEKLFCNTTSENVILNSTKDYYQNIEFPRFRKQTNLSLVGQSHFTTMFFTIAYSQLTVINAHSKKYKEFVQEVAEAALAKIRYHICNENGISKENYSYRIRNGIICNNNKKEIRLLKEFKLFRNFDGHTISLTYDGYNILDISDEWRYMLTNEVQKKYKLGRFSTYELKLEFAKYLVNILNNR